jgi:hypothetical protein
MNFVKNAAAGAILGGSVLFTAGLGVANAQPVETPDGLVGITVGDVTILSGVTPEVAATTAGAICGTGPDEVGALAQQVDSEGTPQTVCAGLPGGDLLITQNVAVDEQPEATENGAESTGPAESPEPGAEAESAPAADAG